MGCIRNYMRSTTPGCGTNKAVLISLNSSFRQNRPQTHVMLPHNRSTDPLLLSALLQDYPLTVVLINSVAPTVHFLFTSRVSRDAPPICFPPEPEPLLLA